MMRLFLPLALLAFAFPAQAEPPVVAQAEAGQGGGGEGAAGPALRRSNRMEFDARLVQGERASGAVYLFHRVSRRLPPLLKLQRDELDRIVMPVLRRPADAIAGISADDLKKAAGAKKGAKRRTLAEEAAERELKASKKKKKKKKKKKRKKKRGKKGSAR